MGNEMRGDLTREIIQTVIDAGPDGISSRGVCDVLAAYDIRGTEAAVRSILSRAARSGALKFDGVYRATHEVPPLPTSASSAPELHMNDEAKSEACVPLGQKI